MAKRAIIGRVIGTKRMRSSRNGNPRFEVTIHTAGRDDRTFPTAVDSSLAYEIENRDYREAEHVFVLDGRGSIERAFVTRTPFTSGKTTHDPEPWFLGLPGAVDRSPYQETPNHLYSPRPEFDNHNPILVQFRWFVAGGGRTPIDTLAYDFLWRLGSPASSEVAYGASESNHARRVLTKLASVYGGD